MHLEIEKLIYGGDGLARLPADEKGRGKTVFLPFAAPGDHVDARIVESRSGFARATIEKILAPSADRIAPGCPYFGPCGGCHYQHLNYSAQLRYKAEILRETLLRTAKLDLRQGIRVHPSQPWNYRNRTRLHLRHAPQFALGYHRQNSHDLLAVEQCPISSPLINQAIAAVWTLGHAAQVPASIHALQLFANHDDNQLLVEGFLRPGSDTQECERFAEAMRQQVSALAGVVLFHALPQEDESHQRAPLTANDADSARAIGAGFLIYEAAGRRYRVSGGSFFQTNRFLAGQLSELVTANESGNLALDLYAGAGLFSLPLSGRFDQVIAVEASGSSFADLRQNAGPNLSPFRATTERFLAERALKLRPDLIVVDPPRAGLGEKTAAAIGRMSASRVTYVSCDPATLSRDLRVLLASGLQVEQVHLVDLFPQTFHMETIVKLVR